MNDYQKREKKIKESRQWIKSTFCSRCKVYEFNNLSNITIENIDMLVKLYDYYIFHGHLSNSLDNNIKISLSSRMTSSGGKTIFTKTYKETNYEIRVSRKILEIFIEDDQSKVICGIEGNDVIDALMLILEHELCHVLEFSSYGNSNCKRQRFKDMAYNIFGHKSSYHEILKNPSNTNKEICFRKGQVVNFIYKGKCIEGIIANINKRATIMVKDIEGNYKDSNGISYVKWYIPLCMLRNKEYEND
ncbi:hypothetical protein [Clostridium sp.]|uniref:hypothetical protein n=1 Tax=Clostridium sp. TaxID=1506 RepID=UPI0032164789